MWNLWDTLLTEQDKAVIKQAGYETDGATIWDSRSLGRNPALLIIDMQRLLIGRNVPILEAIGDYRAAMGDIAWKALSHITPFVQAARWAKVPVIYTRVIPKGRSADDPSVQIIEPLAPLASDLVVDKRYTSAFYGTDLLTYLIRRRIDTLIVVGNSTSGCVRGTVVDARQHGFHPLVPVECVFDRIEASHKIGLLDMWMKYAAVMPVAEALEYIGQTRERP